jgi:hypothetical protein
VGELVSDATMQRSVLSAAEEPGSSLSDVAEAAGMLAESPDPVVVFESLVQLSAPLVCDSATASVCTDGETTRTIVRPSAAMAPRSRLEGVVIDFGAESTGDHPAYHGVVSFGFRTQHERQPYVGQLLVERAAANVERARLVETAARHKTAMDHLEVALTSNREIGVAVGIVMVNHQLTDEQAFELLSRTSQHRNRKLRVIAHEVARTGVLELPAGLVVDRGDKKRPRLTSVPRARD